MKKDKAITIPANPVKQTNTGRLCSVYCPTCGKVTERVSFNLLREAERVKVVCPNCGGLTFLEYDGKTVEVSYIEAAAEGIYTELAKKREAERKAGRK